MRSAIGVNSVRATLEKSLLRAQKRFNLSNPSSAAKESLLKQKSEARQVQKSLQRLARQNRLLLGSEVPDDQVAADWRDLLVNPIHLEFEPATDSYEDFINQFKTQFSRFSKNSAKSKEIVSLPLESDTSILKSSKKSLKGESKKLKKLRKILKRAKLAISLNKCEDEEILIPISTEQGSKSKLELRRENRLKIRRIEKAIKKEAQRLRKEAKELLRKEAADILLKKPKKQKMKDMTISGSSEVETVSSHAGGGNSVLDSSKTNVTAKVTIVTNGIAKKTVEPQLPKPKFTIFGREKIQLGWAQKYGPGCGFMNAGNSCYLNATLQAVFHIPSFVNWITEDRIHRSQCQSSQKFQQCMVCAMRATLEESLEPRRECMRPNLIHAKLRLISQNFVYGRQEDAHEFLRHLLESMETSYLRSCGGTNYDTRSKETTPLGQIFGGYLRTEVTCIKCHHVSTTFQPLAELQLDIRHATSVAEAVGYHFRKEKVDNNDYKCEGCRAIVPVIKQFSLELPPVVLCLQLKRFTLFGGKLSKAIQCNRELDMTRFLHKSQASLYPKNLKYRMVSLITHIGSSPNGGHYTAIAESSTGVLYQFDDSYVRSLPTPTSDSVSSDAYVIIYEMVDTKDTKNGIIPSVSPSAQIRNNMTSVVVNGFSSQRFPKPSTATSASPITSSPINREGAKPLKFVFNQSGSKLSNPFASNNSNNSVDKKPIIVSVNTPNKVLKTQNSTPINSPTTNGNKTFLAGEMKAKNERTPITFSLKKPGLENGCSNVLTNRTTLTPVKPSDRPSVTQRELKKSPSPKRNGSIGSSVHSSTTTNRTSLVPYDDDDSTEGTPSRNSRERSSTPKNNGDSIVKMKFEPSLVTASIKSWSDTGSLLAKSTEVSKKRELEISRSDSYNEEFDAGRTKKQKLDTPRPPGRDNSGVNKFQNYEDQRRLVNERSKSLTNFQQKSPGVFSSGFTKDPYRSHHQSINGSGGSYGSDSRLNSSQYNNTNQGRQEDKPFHFHYNQNRGNSYSGNGYDSYGGGGFKRYNSAPSYNRSNDNRSHHRGGGHGGGRGSWRHPGKKHHFNNNKSRNYYR